MRRELRRPRRRRPPRRPRALARARAVGPVREGRSRQESRPAYRMTPGRSTARAGLALVANAGAAVVMHATILQPCEARPVDSTAEPFGQMTERVEDPPRSKVRILHGPSRLDDAGRGWHSSLRPTSCSCAVARSAAAPVGAALRRRRRRASNAIATSGPPPRQVGTDDLTPGNYDAKYSLAARGP